MICLDRGRVVAKYIFDILYKKVKLSLCLTKHHAMKTYWESGCIAPRIPN
jgi:hypothetical protein